MLAGGAITVIALLPVLLAENMREGLAHQTVDGEQAQGNVTLSLGLAAIIIGLAIFLFVTGPKRH